MMHYDLCPTFSVPSSAQAGRAAKVEILHNYGPYKMCINKNYVGVVSCSQTLYPKSEGPPSWTSLVPRPHPLSRGEGSGTLRAIFGAGTGQLMVL